MVSFYFDLSAFQGKWQFRRHPQKFTMCGNFLESFSENIIKRNPQAASNEFSCSPEKLLIVVTAITSSSHLVTSHHVVCFHKVLLTHFSLPKLDFSSLFICEPIVIMQSTNFTYLCDERFWDPVLFWYGNTWNCQQNIENKFFFSFAIVTRNRIGDGGVKLTCSRFIPGKQQQQRLNVEFMGFDRYLTNKHCHRNSAFDSVQHKKASKEGKSHSKLGDKTFCMENGSQLATNEANENMHASQMNRA